MKNLLYIIIFMICFTAVAQTQTENYIKTKVYTVPSTGVLTENDTLVSIAYFDGLGRIKQNIAIKGGGDKLSHNLLPWKSDWILGEGSTAFFNKNGQESDNERIMGVNPFGKNAMLWRCGNDPESDGDGGWNTDYFPVDKTVTYRYTVWVKRTGGNSGHSYHGTQNVNNLDGTPNANPYFWYGDPPQLDQWYLLVGLVHPHSYTGGDTGISGVYDMQGNKVIDGSEFKWDASTTTSRFRNYLYYSTDTNVKQYFYNPILQKLDGTEASLDDVLLERKAPDVVTPVVYDGFGRQTRDYLPFAAPTQNGQLYNDPVAQTEAFYNVVKYDSTANPWSEKILENSPLNRILEQGAPGAAWMADPLSESDHTIKFGYDTNIAGEVRLFDVNLTSDFIPTLENNGFYQAGQLNKITTKDENWQPGDGKLHTTEEFTDKQGRTILKRTYADMPEEPQATHDTWYVYDDFGNLTYVIPPKVNAEDGISAEEFDELCYRYIYDHRDRLTEKKLPGKGSEYIVYNKLDQPVFTQDQNLAGQEKWLFTRYDKFGRTVYTGLFASAASRDSLQTIINNAAVLYESKTNTPTDIDGTEIYYTNLATPNTNQEVLTVTYYDDYDFDVDGGVSEDAYGITPAGQTKGLATGSKTRVLGTGQWITTVLYYDEKARPVYTYSRNDYLGVTDKIKYKLDFTGKVLEATAVHSKDGQTDITSIEKFSYDPVGRLLKHTHQLAGQAEETLTENIYDALGQLIQKKVGNNTAAPLQTVDYSYNIRGWLKQINDVNNTGSDLFSFRINYNDPTTGTPLFNGNISQTRWRTNNIDSSLKTYTYSYDPLNRITGATDNTGHYNLNAISYDKNGNILSLSRQGHINEDADSFGAMDNLNYIYNNTNRLLRVEDTANDIYGFKDDAVSTPDNDDDYTYDNNGNMVSDTNKGITGISYNHLNLPKLITFELPVGSNGGQRTISYVYDATGVKLQKRVNDFVIEGTNPLGSLTVTNYAGNHIYEQTVNADGSMIAEHLKFFNHAEGYIEPDGTGSYNYVYQYKDHLGNVRLSYSDSNDDGLVGISEIIEESNYYPFGLLQRGYNNLVNGTENKFFTYNGVELEESLDLNMYEMDLRQYDPAIARWIVQDPIVHFDYSPYQAFDNNPVFWADPSGGDSINGETVGADGLTNSQWLELSRPGGGGFDAMRAQSRENTEVLAKRRRQASVEVGEGEFGVVEQDACPKCPDKEKRKLAIMMAKRHNGNAQDYYDALTNPDFISDRVSENITWLGNISLLFGGASIVQWFKGLFTKKVVTTLTVENIAGFYVRGSTSFLKGTYTRTIQSLASLSEGSSIPRLLSTLEAQARAKGAKRIIINGINIVETRLINQQAAQRLGYAFKQTSSNSIQLIKSLK